MTLFMAVSIRWLTAKNGDSRDEPMHLLAATEVEDREAVALGRGYRSLSVNQPTGGAAQMSPTEANGPDLCAEDVPLIVRGRRNPAPPACASTTLKAVMGPLRFSALVAFVRRREHLHF